MCDHGSLDLWLKRRVDSRKVFQFNEFLRFLFKINLLERTYYSGSPFNRLFVLYCCTANDLKYLNKFVCEGFWKQSNDKEGRIWWRIHETFVKKLEHFSWWLYIEDIRAGGEWQAEWQLAKYLHCNGVKNRNWIVEKKLKHATFETICVHLAAAKSVWIGAKTDKWYLEPVVRVIWYTSPNHQLYILIFRPLIGCGRYKKSSYWLRSATPLAGD